MNDRYSEFRSGLLCPSCGRSLAPVPTESDVLFHCKSGHELPLEVLTSASSYALRCGLEDLLCEWKRQHRAILGTLEDARRRGYLDIAEIFARLARGSASRIDHLETGLARSESGKLVDLPSSSG